MKLKGRKISLRHAWYGIIIFASVLPAFVIVLWLANQAHDILLEREMLKEEVFHKQVETHLSLETERLLSVLQNKSDPIADFISDGYQGNARALMERVISRDTMFNTVTLYDLDAKVVMTVNRVGHSPVVIQKKSSEFVIPKHGRVFIGSPSRLVDHHFEFIIAVPLFDQGKVLGVMLGTVNINEFWSSIQRKIPKHDLTNVYLVDGRGILLADKHDNSFPMGKLLSHLPVVRTLLAHKNWNSSTPYQGIDGEEVYAIGSRIANLQWGIVSEIPVSRIAKPIRQVLIVLIVVILLTYFVFAVFGVMLIQRMLMPISKLVLAMKYAESGDYVVPTSHSSLLEVDELIQGFSQLLSEIKEREKELVQAQKMESIGVLVGGIAHDFNNILAAMAGNSFLIKTYLSEGKIKASMAKVDAIEMLNEQAAKMVEHLLAYARKGVVQKESVLLNQLLAETMGLIKVAVPEDIDLDIHISEQDLWLLADEPQIQQMILNLLNNARDAVKATEFPHICLTLEYFLPTLTFQSKYAHLKAAAYARLSIQDNGCGIAEHDVQQIFDPFFTTKSVGEGSGLGLSMIYGMVQSHEGLITVKSAEGAGTRFDVYLPLMDAPEQSNEIEVVQEKILGHGETILFVDDEPHIRETSEEVLQALGYQIIMAKNGLEAIDLFEKYTSDIAVIISDVIMPHMGGVELMRRIRQKNDQIPIILMTGYDKASTLADEKAEDCIVLSKPVDFDVLNSSIRKLLEGK